MDTKKVENDFFNLVKISIPKVAKNGQKVPISANSENRQATQYLSPTKPSEWPSDEVRHQNWSNVARICMIDSKFC